MRRQGSGFGFVVLLAVLAIVLLLASRAWKASMPVAAQALKPAPASKNDAAAEAPSTRSIDADLKRVQRQADRHASEVQDAVKQSD